MNICNSRHLFCLKRVAISIKALVRLIMLTEIPSTATMGRNFISSHSSTPVVLFRQGYVLT